MKDQTLIVLSLGGVVVDGTSSMRDTAVAAAGIYLEEICAIADGARLVTSERVEAFSALPGFGNAEALAFALVYSLFVDISGALRPQPARLNRPATVHRRFKRLGLRYGTLFGLVERNIDRRLELVVRNGGGVDGLRRACSQDAMEGYVLYTGEIGAIEREAAAARGSKEAEALAKVGENVLGRLCEEVYLGDALFAQTYGVSPMAPRGAGILADETRRASPEVCDALAERGTLVLMSSRPTPVTEATLTRFGFEASQFATIWCTPISNPPSYVASDYEGLLAHAASVCGASFERSNVFVVLAGREDIEAAVEVGLRPVGFAPDRAMRSVLKEAGARAVVGKLETLLKALDKRTAKGN